MSGYVQDSYSRLAWFYMHDFFNKNGMHIEGNN